MAQIGRVVDVASTRDDVVPQCNNIIEGPSSQGNNSSSSSEEDSTARMPVQFVKLNVFRHLSSFEERTLLELEDAEKYVTTDGGWQIVVQVDKDCWIRSSAICDLSFVFMEEDVSSGALDDCRGMYNFFVVKYRYAANDRCISGIPPHSCPPFPEKMQGFADYWCVDQCKLLYNNLRQIRCDMQRILCRIAQSQGDSATRTAKLQIPSSSWFYMKYFMSCRGIESIPGVKNCKPRTVLSWGLAYQSVRHTEVLDVLRFDTHGKLTAFHELFGNTIVFGVRKKRPRFSDSKLVLCVNDVINAVCPSNDEHTPAPTGEANDVQYWRSFRNGIQKDGIDLAYNEDDGILHVVVRYHKVVVNNALDETEMACLKRVGVGIGLSTGANEALRSPNNDTDSIYPGMEFMDNNFVMRVVSATASEVLARKKYMIRHDLTTVEVEATHASVVIYHDTASVLNKIREMLE